MNEMACRRYFQNISFVFQAPGHIIKFLNKCHSHKLFYFEQEQNNEPSILYVELSHEGGRTELLFIRYLNICYRLNIIKERNILSHTFITDSDIISIIDKCFKIVPYRNTFKKHLL